MSPLWAGSAPLTRWMEREGAKWDRGMSDAGCLMTDGENLRDPVQGLRRSSVIRHQSFRGPTWFPNRSSRSCSRRRRRTLSTEAKTPTGRPALASIRPTQTPISAGWSPTRNRPPPDRPCSGARAVSRNGRSTGSVRGGAAGGPGGGPVKDGRPGVFSPSGPGRRRGRARTRRPRGRGSASYRAGRRRRPRRRSRRPPAPARRRARRGGPRKGKAAAPGPGRPPRRPRGRPRRLRRRASTASRPGGPSARRPGYSGGPRPRAARLAHDVRGGQDQGLAHGRGDDRAAPLAVPLAHQDRRPERLVVPGAPPPPRRSRRPTRRPRPLVVASLPACPASPSPGTGPTCPPLIVAPDPSEASPRRRNGGPKTEC